MSSNEVLSEVISCGIMCPKMSSCWDSTQMRKTDKYYFENYFVQRRSTCGNKK